VLVVALVTTLFAAALAWSAVSVGTADRSDAAHELQKVEARSLAEAGLHRAMATVRSTMRLDVFDPVAELDKLLFVNGDTTQPQTWTVAADEPLVRNNRTYGTFTVVVTAVANADDSRDLTITATGYVPDRANVRAKATSQAVVRAGLQPGEVFDYSYFINNWGWFYGDTILSHGNVRSNAQFDAANYAPSVFGTPRYTSMSLVDPAHPDLQGYQDDNKDGITDGSDGGIYSGWNIVNSGNVLGMGGLTKNQHDYDAQIPMPNLNDLSTYEVRAKQANASIQIGGGTDASGNPLPPTTVCNAVLGDEPGEMQNVVLIGTAAKPIILNGPVVVRGDVIIKGVVTGQGTIYSGRNVYVADNLTYLNGPSSYVPSDESEATTEAWLAANQGKDFCGLFAKKHVVMGDFTDGWWRMFVNWWLQDPMNSSAEDAGLDGMPNTRAGRDGILGNEDDDTLEGDGVWTVDHYTQAQADLGLIPAGKNVGDPIPGTGEDIDGNGQYDGTTQLSEFDLSAALDSGQWAGNVPAGTTSFSSLSSIAITDVNAALYTNHTVAMLTLAWGQDFHLFGSVVSRNESLIYGTNTMNLYADRRLSAGGEFGTMLPRTLAPLKVLSWTQLDADARVLVTP
jgi:hypothetical protein